LYHPYFRGKQFDLLTIRETAETLSSSNFTPIIEPVRGSLGALIKALNSIVENEGNAIVIVNPEHGELSGGGEPLSRMLQEKYLERNHISAGILLKSDTSLREAMAVYNAHLGHSPVFVHSGFPDAKGLAVELGRPTKESIHIFVEDPGVKLAARHFKGATRVLLRDGFRRRKNRDYPAVEPFSDLHVTYTDEAMDGFGDFLIVGDEYADGGGLPVVLAIHLTFIDPDQDDIMQIYHFKSSRAHVTQSDPAGKFAEALAEMISILDMPGCKVYETGAVSEFRELFEKRHFPGLGYIKKLSMSHHIQTFAEYFGTKE
jgi:hypothetical protein